MGEARYSGYSSGDGKYKTFVVPVTFYVIRKLKSIDDTNKEKVYEKIYELEEIKHSFIDCKNMYTTFWWHCLAKAKSRIVKKIANFIIDYDSPQSEYFCDALSLDQWAYDSKGIYCIDPFHKSELSEILWLSKKGD